MRIVHVSDCFAPRTGGMETQVGNLARQQVMRGHSVTVITATPEGSGGSGSADVAVERVVFPVPGDLPVHPRARARIAQQLTALQPDVIHIHLGEISLFGWGALRAVRHLGMSAVTTVHSVWSPVMRRGLAPLGRHWTRHPMVMTAVSAMAAHRVASALGVHVGVLPNGIDAGVWAPRPRVEHDELRFIAVQRLAPRKRTGSLIRAFATASLGNPGMRLDIVGEGPERERLSRRVHRWGRSDAIRFHGRLAPEEIRELFCSSDVFVQASRNESFGIAALEARASGLPVLAFRGSGTADFIRDRQDGLLVSDDTELARAMLQLSNEPGLRESLTVQSRLTRVAQTWDALLPRVDEFYEQARDAIRLRR